jgi:hypothetical protein
MGVVTYKYVSEEVAMQQCFKFSYYDIFRFCYYKYKIFLLVCLIVTKFIDLTSLLLKLKRDLH